MKKNQLKELNYSQSKIDGFDIEVAQKTRILLIGAGGIGGHVLLGLIRKGYRFITNLDSDVVDLRNCSRQLFSKRDIGKLKVYTLAENILPHGLFPSTINAIPLRLQETQEQGMDFSKYDVIIVCVDNDIARVASANIGLKYGIPVVVGALSGDGNEIALWLQESKPHTPCFVCLQPDAFNNKRYPCEGGIIDVLQIVSGFMVYCVDTLLCGRSRDWNYRHITLNGIMPDTKQMVKQRKDCLLCKGQ